MDKTAGILFAISSLPSKYGIGCFSKEAYKFVDWLVEAGQTFWQILPLGPTGYGDSPYQSFSTFAGNPYFIDLETLISEGLLTREECDMKNNIMDGMYCSARLAREAGIRTVQSIKRSWRRMKRGCMTIAYIWQ